MNTLLKKINSHSNARQSAGSTQHFNSESAGFSLVELLVAVAIFTIVVTVAMIGLLSVVDASRDEQAKSDAVDSLNFAVDDMVRRIRTGYNFDCGSDNGASCPNGDDTFYFTSSEVGEAVYTNPRVRYRLAGPNNDQLQRTIEGNAELMTGPSLSITDLTFYVFGASPGLDGEQSRVLLSITGEAGQGDNTQSFSIQTTITQRLLFDPN